MEQRMLLDDFLPQFDMRTSYVTRIAASTERVYANLRTAKFDHLGRDAGTLRGTYAPIISIATAPIIRNSFRSTIRSSSPPEIGIPKMPRLGPLPGR